MLFLKRVFPLILCAALCAALSVPACAAARPSVSAESCILVHADTGRVLYEQDAHRQMLIASTTKLLTALVVLDHCALDESVVITADSAGMEGSSMYLRAGQTRTVEQLLYGLLLVSGNDAAMALALHVSGSAGDFAVLMNEKAAALGMTESHFMNPHGLDQEGHYSTAADLATLGVACLESAALLRILSARSYTVEDCVYLNHNKLLWRCQGCVGGKTGYTKAAVLHRLRSGKGGHRPHALGAFQAGLGHDRPGTGAILLCGRTKSLKQVQTSFHSSAFFSPRKRQPKNPHIMTIPFYGLLCLEAKRKEWS